MKIKVMLISVLLLASAYAIGISISPVDHTMRNVLKGERSFIEYYIGNQNPYNITVSVEVRGEIADFCYANQSQLVIAPKDIGKVKIIINPSNETASGLYKGEVSVAIKEIGKEKNKSAGSGASIKLAATSRLNIEITGEEIKRMDFAAGIRLSQTEFPLPALLEFTTKNTGNVRIKPYIILEVYSIDPFTLGPGRLVKTYSFEADMIMPQEGKRISKKIDISDLQAKNYSCILRIYPDIMSYRTGEKAAMELSLSLIIYPRGTFSIIGKLSNLEIIASDVGNPMKISADFENLGKQILDAKLVAEIYFNDVLKAVVESKALESRPEEKIKLIAYYTPDKAGLFKIKAYALYGIKQSNVVEKEVYVGGRENIIFYTGIVLALAVVFIFLYKLLVKKRETSKKSRKPKKH